MAHDRENSKLTPHAKNQVLGSWMCRSCIPVEHLVIPVWQHCTVSMKAGRPAITAVATVADIKNNGRSPYGLRPLLLKSPLYWIAICLTASFFTVTSFFGR